MSTTVIILGMHRSGTSCLTGSLEAHGLSLGEVNNAAPHNKKGNKENKKTWPINDSVLDYSGGSWDVPPKKLLWNDSARILREDFIAQYNHEHVWGFKDPRCVLTLPFWLEGLSGSKIIATFRHPLSVAKSLEKRNGFTISKSLSLWNIYNRLILKYHRQFNFPIVSYDWCPDKYNGSIANLVLQLGLLRENEKNIEPIFYDKSLKHHISTNCVTEHISAEQLETYSLLCEAADNSFKQEI